jgi:cation diffusion facilitator family transporter
MAEESRRAVFAAIAGNVLITVAKFIAAAFSGSAAMLAESIHSLIDTGNGALVLYGMRRSRKPADLEHPFGYGHELYFWTMLVGMIVFGLGGGMSIITGMSHLTHPKPPEDTTLNYIVIGVAAIFEAGSWYFGVKAFRHEQHGRGIIETIRATKDPTTFAVVLEDSAALVGLALAFLGIFLSVWLHAPWLDGAASLLIGVLLCVVAFVMVYESEGLLVGEGVGRATLQRLRSILQADESVESVAKLLTIYLAPDDVLLAMELRFHSAMTAVDIRHAITRLRQNIQKEFPNIRRLFIDATSICE